MKLSDILNNNIVDKKNLYKSYVKIVDNPSIYQKITKRKMVEELLEFYSKAENLLSICTLKEIKFLKSLVENNNKLETIHKYHFETVELDDKFIICVGPFETSIYEELLDTVKKAVNSFDENKCKEREKVIVPLLGYLKTIYSIHLNDFPISLVNKLGFNNIQSLVKYLEKNSLFNYYCLIHRKIMSLISKVSFISDIIIEKRKENKYPFPENYDLKKYENIFYYGFDIDNKIINENLNEIKFKDFFTYGTMDVFFDLIALNHNGNDLIEELKFINPFNEDKIEKNKKTIIKLAKELPSAILNGYSEKEFNSIVKPNINLSCVNVTEKEYESYNKVLYSYIDYTSQRYNLKFNIDEFTAPELKKVLNCLWNNIDLLSFEIIKTNKYNFTKNEIQIAKDFKKCRKGKFLILKHVDEGTIFIDEEYSYMVKGLKIPVKDIVPAKLPIFVETTLFQFKNEIICDGCIVPYNIKIDKKLLDGLYNEVDENDVITSLEQMDRCDKKWLKK